MSDIVLSLKNINKRAEQIMAMSKKGSEVGVLKNSKGVSKDGKTSKLGAAEIAAIMANGTIKAGRSRSVIIPARDYQGIAFKKNKEKYKKIIIKAIRNGINPKTVFSVVGMKAAADQKLAIRDITPRNAPATIAKKGKDSPLIDTGNLYKSITSKVVKID